MRFLLLLPAFASFTLAGVGTALYDLSSSLLEGSDDYLNFASAVNFTGELHIQGGASVLNVQLNDVKLGLNNEENDRRSPSSTEEQFQMTATLERKDSDQMIALDDISSAQLVMPDIDSVVKAPVTNVKLSTSHRRDNKQQVQITAGISKKDAARVTGRRMIGELSIKGLGSVIKLNDVRPSLFNKKSYLGQGDKIQMDVGLSGADAALLSVSSLLDSTGRLRLRWAGGAFDAPFKAGNLVPVS